MLILAELFFFLGGILSLSLKLLSCPFFILLLFVYLLALVCNLDL